MPFTRISLRAGKPAAYHEALTTGIYAAMRETFAVPEDDFFAVVHQHDGPTFAYDPGYFGIRRDDDLVYQAAAEVALWLCGRAFLLFVDLDRPGSGPVGLRPRA